jgi:hypothetical protein
VASIGVAVLLPTFAAALSAHEKKIVGALQLTIGWSDEPVFSGSRNAIEVRVADAAGAPVNDPDASLSVDVSFGDERITVPLSRTRDAATFKGWLLPNRPGTYMFHFTGKVKGQAIDTTSTCSDKTFDCVADISAIQFPAKDPSVGQLAERVTRALPREERAADEAAGTRRIAIAAGWTMARDGDCRRAVVAFCRCGHLGRRAGRPVAPRAPRANAGRVPRHVQRLGREQSSGHRDVDGDGHEGRNRADVHGPDCDSQRR